MCGVCPGWQHRQEHLWLEYQTEGALLLLYACSEIVLLLPEVQFLPL